MDQKDEENDSSPEKEKEVNKYIMAALGTKINK
jgi:hypothetical protein